MRKNKIIISILFLCLINLIFLTGCSNEDSSNGDSSKEKVVQELDYLDTHIVSIINKLNNINLENYNVTSEEINLQKQSSTSGSGGRK